MFIFLSICVCFFFSSSFINVFDDDNNDNPNLFQSDATYLFYDLFRPVYLREQPKPFLSLKRRALYPRDP